MTARPADVISRHLSECADFLRQSEQAANAARIATERARAALDQARLVAHGALDGALDRDTGVLVGLATVAATGAVDTASATVASVRRAATAVEFVQYGLSRKN